LTRPFVVLPAVFDQGIDALRRSAAWLVGLGVCVVRDRYDSPMTGGEIVAGAAAGKAVAAAAKGIDHEQKAVNKELLAAAKLTPGFEAAAATYGQRQAVKQQVLLNLYRPLALIMGVSREYFDTDFGIDLADKTRDIPEENLQTPKASVAGPAMQGLAYSLEEPDLKNLYLELLARASDKQEAMTVHPSFARVIGDLSEAEAQYLPQFIVGKVNRAIVQIQMVYEPGESNVLVRNHVFDLRDPQGAPLLDLNLPTYVDNWIRLGLVEVRYDAFLQDKEYISTEERAEVKSMIAEVNLAPVPSGYTKVRGHAAKGYLAPTAFGKQFAAAVGMTPFVPQAES
jgi:hypothetical protein